jgi:mono/diheme cytochrome c family protein
VKAIQQRTGRLVTGRVIALGAAATLASGMLLPLSVSAQSPALPDGPGKQVVLDNCTACHTLELITSKRKSPDDWDATVNRMIANGVTLDESQQEQVVAYLAKNFGKPSTGATAQASATAAPASSTKPVSH